MRSIVRNSLCVLVAGVFVSLVTIAAAQSQTDNPVQSLKNIWGNAKKSVQQPNGQAQPGQPGAKPGQQKTGQPAQAQNSVNDSGAFTPPPGTKVDPAVMAPIEQGASFAVSPHGVHVATMSHAGSRVVIVYDGAPGPKLDTVFLQDGAHGVVFSADGNHWAYCAAQGQEWVVMRDGQEFVRGHGAANGQVNLSYCHDMHYTTNSKHLYFMSVVDASNVSSATRFVFDGKASAPGADTDLRNYAFSKDGDHYAYIWTDPASRTGARWQMIVDGQPSALPGSVPQWSADSKHLFTKRTVQVAGARGGNVQEVFFDGKPYMKADNVTLNIPPVGDMVVALVWRSTQPPTQFLVAAGKVVPGSELPGNRIGQVTFSPDGRHFGAVFSDANGRQSAFIDGKKGEDYTRLDGNGLTGNSSPLIFTADSAHSAYLAYSAQPNAQFLIFDGRENGPVQSTTWAVTSPVGGHLMTAGYGQVTLDGQILKLANDPRSEQASNLSFSPDGNHYAFVIRERGGLTLNVDGVQQTAFAAILQGPQTNQTTRPYIWSPDSKHFAYFCRPTNPAANDDMYLCLDGKGVRLGSPAAYGNLTFTSDSNHLLWTRNVGSTFRAFADGKPVVEGFMPAVSGFVPETWQATADGGVAVLLEDETTLKRVTITPTQSTSLATLFGGATTVASGK